MARSALLLGATGLVGGHCLQLLLSNPAYERVTTLGRRPMIVQNDRHEHHAIDFSRLHAFREIMKGQDVFCCLGTTMKQAGSREAFRKVDFLYPYEVAKYALERGAEQYLLVSAVGADRKSPFFYNRVKGETERAIERLDYNRVQIFRPSLLLGDRSEERRGEEFAEKILGGISFFLRGPLSSLRPVEAKTVAAAMISVAINQPEGLNIYEPSDIRRWGRQK